MSIGIIGSAALASFQIDTLPDCETPTIASLTLAVMNTRDLEILNVKFYIFVIFFFIFFRGRRM